MRQHVIVIAPRGAASAVTKITINTIRDNSVTAECGIVDIFSMMVQPGALPRDA